MRYYMLFKIKLIFIASFICSPVYADNQNKSVEIINGFHGIESVIIGEEFRNKFSVPSKKEALYKIQNLKRLKNPVTLQKFLGDEIKFIRIVFFDSSLGNSPKAKTFLENLLKLAIVTPFNANHPRLEIHWSEHTEAYIKALVFFKNGHIGRIESNGVHLFLEDALGTYWWYRSDPGIVKLHARINYEICSR